MKKVLHLTLKKKWFDMILSGEKKEEYREVKQYWIKRLLANIEHLTSLSDVQSVGARYKSFDAIIFTNGYSPTSPQIEIECTGVEINVPIAEWTDDDYLQKYFVLKLGKILSTKNIHP